MSGVAGKSGRKKGSLNKTTLKIRAFAAKLCPEMLRILAKMARSEKTAEPVRKDCSALVLAYGVGKPKEMVELSGPDGGPIPVSEEGTKAALVDFLQELKSGIKPAKETT